MLPSERKERVIIIGAGLSGLATAYMLERAGISSIILEARNRPGGRIETITTANGKVEMGATWYGNYHHQLRSLLDILKIESYEQYYGQKVVYDLGSTIQSVDFPNSQEPSFKIRYGTHEIIHQLVQNLKKSQIRFDEPVKKMSYARGMLTLETNLRTYEADRVISTLPPNLLVNTVTFDPELPEELETISRSTHTWMGESIKSAFSFENSFWRTPHVGSLFSNTGPMVEMYDHSVLEEGAFALKGFMNPEFADVDRELRKHRAKEQLTRIFGKDAVAEFSYYERVWSKEQYTYYPYPAQVAPHQHNGHPIFRKSYYHGQLLLAGSETAESYAGYMDGAVESASRAALAIIQGK